MEWNLMIFYFFLSSLLYIFYYNVIYYFLLNVKENKEMSWTLSGREAEALHAEEDDTAEAEESDDEDPIMKIIQSRYYSLF